MPVSVDTLIAQLREAASTETLFDAYMTQFASSVAELAEDVSADPNEANIVRWLKVYAVLSPLATELPSSVTLALFQRNQPAFQSAKSELSPEEQAAVDELLTSSAEQDLNIAALQVPIPAAPPDVPVLGQFKIVNTFDGSRVRLYQGTLTVKDRGGSSLGMFSARTGGFVADYRTHNGPTPPGLYKIGSFIRHPGLPGMTLNGVEFCFVLSPLAATNVFRRSGLCIHPDQPPPGTHGCIGITAGADELTQCASSLANLMQGGAVGISVEYLSIDHIA